MKRLKLIASLSPAELQAYLYHWPYWARENQRPPKGDWTTWLILAGRGFGKTRVGAEWIRYCVEGKTPLGSSSEAAERIAFIAETAADARDVMVEGEAGILEISPPDFRPLYEPSKRRLTWPNGAVATLYNAREPDQLRGPSHDHAWFDELAKFRYAEDTWDQAQFGLRLGSRPRQIITTTPRPIKVLKQIIADPDTVITRGSTYDNISNIAEAFAKKIISRYAGTRLGRQEIDAELLEDTPGALWTRDRIDELRKGWKDKPDLVRVVVAIDPAVTSGDDSDLTGIIVAGKGSDGHAYVIDDLTMKGTPDQWARVAVEAYHKYEADRIVAEVNQGGDMVEHLIRTVDSNVSYKHVHAMRGKVIRAEPVAALYEQGKVHHLGSFSELEDQMCAFTNDFDKKTAGYSPDRVDALVWALSEFMFRRPAPTPQIRF